MTSVAFLARVSLDEASGYFSNQHKKLQDQKEQDLQRETWKQYPLYQESRETLVKMCSKSGLLTTGKKHQLVRRIAENNACYEDPVTLDESELYDGDVESIPSSSAGLIRLCCSAKAYFKDSPCFRGRNQRGTCGQSGAYKGRLPGSSIFKGALMYIAHYRGCTGNSKTPG